MMHNNFLLDNYQKRLFVHNADFHLFSKKDLTGKFRKVFHRQEKICDLKALIYGVFHSFHKVFHRCMWKTFVGNVHEKNRVRH